MRGYQHQLKRDSAEPLICADRDALGLDEREESGPTPVGSAARRITAKLSLVQSIVKGEQRERQKRGRGSLRFSVSEGGFKNCLNEFKMNILGFSTLNTQMGNSSVFRSPSQRIIMN